MDSTLQLKTLRSFIFVLLLSPISSFAEKTIITLTDTVECLELSGAVSALDDSTDYLSIELVRDNKQVELLEVHNFQPFKFNLLPNAHYTVKITKPGFFAKSISVSTELPQGMNISNYKFHFETDLVKVEDKKAEKANALDFPIALIKYDEKKRQFSYSKKYSEMINAEIDNDMYKIFGGDGEAPPPPKPKKEKKEKTKK